MHEVFLPREYAVPAWMHPLVAALSEPLMSTLRGLGVALTRGAGQSSLLLLPIQIHGIYYGLFASFIAPFGGFLASGIKRAYKRKDFDAFLPGMGVVCGCISRVYA